MIYKILRKSEWQELKTTGHSSGAPVDIADGFIHFSTASTVSETASKYFAGINDLMLLAVDPDKCTPLKWEPSRGGVIFPHLYRDLKLADIVWAKPLPCTATGHDFPAGIL